MDESYGSYQNEPFSTRLLHFIQGIWPSVYRTINDLFFGTIHFIIDTLSGLWRR
ncbi:hypothetical protein M1271_07335 [Patescibacteria group bacterium]|nr:hypothetical protein [Patescibacteria group bacterium]MCL5797429.1 hypothetical protein [Patescibacteria group bacterium]